MHDLLKARPRSMAIRLLHGESSTSTAKRPSSQHRSEESVGECSVRIGLELATKLGSQINTIACLVLNRQGLMICFIHAP